MPETHQIGPFRLDADAPALTLDGQPVALGERATAVLATLVKSRGEYVPKRRIMDSVWTDVVVEEGNLAVQISALRRVLASAPGGERWLETLPRRGYRFVGPVAELTAAPSGAAGRSNLPAALTSFVGRKREVAEVTRLLTQSRLVTLVGTGGIGKTRLALGVAADVVDAYRDGVRSIEFAALADAKLVAQTAAGSFGLREGPGRSAAQTLTAHLESSQRLLVLDNAEHLLGACAELAEALLRACPEVALLVTSRERLGIPGELTYRVPPLALPERSPTATVVELALHESVRLFVDRAKCHVPSFTLHERNAPALASIVRRLDGIPLAIELAAARVRSMSPEEIDQHLDERFTLLTGGPTNALPRQKTLRSLIDWSHDLLNPQEQALFRRLAVFAGGWTLEEAERVCTDATVPASAVLDLVTSLVDKNLAAAVERDGATRYHLLETVRQYAEERLQNDPEAAQWRERHAGAFLTLAETAEPLLNGPEQRAWLDRLETEHDNLRVALAGSIARDPVCALRLAGALWRFWYVRGYLNEGGALLAAALAAAADQRLPAVRAKALNGAGGLARRRGDYRVARELHEEGLALQRELGDERGIAAALNNLGIVAREQGENAAAEMLYAEGLALRRKLDDRWGTAVSLNNLGLVVENNGDFPGARALLEESLALFRVIGDRQGIAYALSNLGLVAYRQGAVPMARELYEESLAGFVGLGDRWGIAWSLEGLAKVALVLAGPRAAAVLWGGADKLRDEIGCPLPPSERPHHEREVATARAAMGDDAAFDRIRAEGRAMGHDAMVAFAQAVARG